VRRQRESADQEKVNRRVRSRSFSLSERGGCKASRDNIWHTCATLRRRRTENFKQRFICREKAENSRAPLPARTRGSGGVSFTGTIRDCHSADPRFSRSHSSGAITIRGLRGSVGGEGSGGSMHLSGRSRRLVYATVCGNAEAAEKIASRSSSCCDSPFFISLGF